MHITKRKIVLTSILAIVILFLIADLIGVGDIADMLRNASPALILLSIPIYLVSWPLRGVRYQQILMQMNYREKLNFLVGCIFLSQSANVVLPARIGDVARAYILKKMKNIPFSTALSSLVVERIFDVLAITLIGGFAIWAARGLLIDRWITDLVTIAGLGMLIAFVVMIVFLRSYTKIGGAITRFAREIALASTNPRTFAIILASSLLIWFFDILTCFVILNAFPETVSTPMIPMIALVFLAITVGNLTKIFPITPGAIGTYEAVLTAIFSLGGIDPSIGFAAAVLDHAVKNSMTLIFGSVYLSHFGLSWARLVEQAEI
ncbi:MAG: lysylphosphatidylglycerol synthase transmembrane domain-containing protein [Euryarchaeota archaeon]|nr:lysylphosphatidylglycerol synthase transmembrane domain-containing protein [Euryarchaeota archaeon]